MNQPIRTWVTVPLLARVATNQLESDWIIRGRRSLAHPRYRILKAEIIEIENILLLHSPVGNTVFLCEATLRSVFILCFSFHFKLYIWLSWLSPSPLCKAAGSQFLKNKPGRHSKHRKLKEPYNHVYISHILLSLNPYFFRIKEPGSTEGLSASNIQDTSPVASSYLYLRCVQKTNKQRY